MRLVGPGGLRVPAKPVLEVPHLKEGKPGCLTPGVLLPDLLEGTQDLLGRFLVEVLGFPPPQGLRNALGLG